MAPEASGRAVAPESSGTLAELGLRAATRGEEPPTAPPAPPAASAGPGRCRQLASGAWVFFFDAAWFDEDENDHIPLDHPRSTKQAPRKVTGWGIDPLEEGEDEEEAPEPWTEAVCRELCTTCVGHYVSETSERSFRDLLVFGPKKKSSTLYGLPLFTITFNSLVILLYLIGRISNGQVLAGLESFFPESSDLAVVDLRDCEDLRGQVWRWVSHQYSHLGFYHLCFNALPQVLFGWVSEKHNGTVRFALMWACGTFGGVCGFWTLDTHARVVGSSGGMYSLFGIHLAACLMNWKSYPIFGLPAWTRVLGIFGFLIFQFFVAFATPNSLTGHYVHLGGVVFGFLAGLAICRVNKIKDWKWGVRLAGWLVILGLGLFCLNWGMTWPPRNIAEGVPWCWAREIKNPTRFGDDAYHCVRCDNPLCIASFASSPGQSSRLADERSCGSRWEVTQR